MGNLTFDINFTADDIVDIRPLSPPQPVWLLTGAADSSIVVKAESKNDRGSWTIGQVAEVMSIVSPGMKKIKVLENSERRALQQYLNLMRLIDDRLDPELTEAINNVQTNLNNPQRTLVKMETLRLTTLKDGDDRASKKIGKALNAPEGLEDMGRVIAADMFNCNNDRFNFAVPSNLGSGCKWGPKHKQLYYLINAGNFMIREDGNQAKIVGMDTYCNSDVVELSRPVPNDWIYSIFNPNQRAQSVALMAERCAHDLRKVIGKKTGVISRQRLDKKAPARIAAGMIDGANLIEQYFRNKYDHQGAIIPQGLPSRANLAGWNWLNGVTTNQAFGNLSRSRYRN